MTNYYADALEVIANDLSIQQMQRVCLEFAKRHPKAFVQAAYEAKNPAAIRVVQQSVQEAEHKAFLKDE